jgi:hypothetical protein
MPMAISITLFEKVPILQLVANTEYTTIENDFSKQLNLFN